MMASFSENAAKFIKFVSNSPSPFHAVDNCKKKLVDCGFKELQERMSWPKLENGGKYYFTRNNSSIVAFTVGSKFKQGNGFTIVAAHTDSPCLKLKPISKKSKKNYLQVGVQTYGGGLWHTWFDKDLGLAGRIIYESGVEEPGVHEKLVKIEKPILRIPTLAIHLDRTVDSGFTFNKESHLLPILGLSNPDQENGADSPNHHAALLERISKLASVPRERILDLELCLFDTQAPCVGGLNEEFIFSARLDNLLMSFCALQSFSEVSADISNQESINMMVLFDNEEVGSQSAYGAGSNLLESALKRIHGTIGVPETEDWFAQSIQRSILISADCAHAIHPNYSEKHEDNHGPEMDRGTVIKINANQRYATTSVTSALIKKIARSNEIPVQEFVVKNDSPCGSTIGPILSSSLGIRTIDVGNAQLSMHSIREVCGVKDITHAINLFQEIYKSFPTHDVN